MKRRSGISLFAIAAACLCLGACQDASSKAPAETTPTTTAPSTPSAPAAEKHDYREITLDEALALHKSGAAFFDVNVPDFREEYGVVTGAKLVDSAVRYDVATTLPADKNAALIFYCTSRS